MLQSQPSKDGLQGTMLQAPEPFWVMSGNCHVKNKETVKEPSSLPHASHKNWSYVIAENRDRVRVGESKGVELAF